MFRHVKGGSEVLVRDGEFEIKATVLSRELTDDDSVLYEVESDGFSWGVWSNDILDVTWSA